MSKRLNDDKKKKIIGGKFKTIQQSDIDNRVVVSVSTKILT